MATKFTCDDPFFFDGQLSADERAMRDAAATGSQARLQPRGLTTVRHDNFERDIMSGLGELGELVQPGLPGVLGLLGSTIEGCGCAGLNHVCCGLAAREVEGVDSGYRGAMSVQSPLVMHPIHAYGSAAQREQYLPTHEVPALVLGRTQTGLQAFY